MSSRRVRQLVHVAAGFARTVPAPGSLLEAVQLLEDGGIRTSREISDHLHAAGLTVGHLPVRALLPIAGLFDLPAAQTVRVVATDDGEAVVVPSAQCEAVQSCRGALFTELRHQIAVPLALSDGEGLVHARWGAGDTGHALRGSEAGWLAEIAADSRLHPHAALLGAAGSGPGGAGDMRPDPGIRSGTQPRLASWWVWRTWSRERVHQGVSIRLAQRLLAVRPRTQEQLQRELSGAIANLPPSQRYGAVVPPVPVLDAWLANVSATEPALTHGAGGWSWALPLQAVDAILQQCCEETGGPVDVADLHAALVVCGYTAAAAKALVFTSPLLKRVGLAKYQLR